jgi:hypothetical protein
MQIRYKPIPCGVAAAGGPGQESARASSATSAFAKSHLSGWMQQRRAAHERQKLRLRRPVFGADLLREMDSE